MLTPKDYQLQTIETLSDFLRRSRALGGPAAAFTQITSEQLAVGLPYFTAPGFESEEYQGMPYVCLRLPTGGGKTLLACLSIPVIQRELLQQERSAVLWLVPSKTIQEQTLAALKNRSHPYRQALENEAGEITAIDLSEALYANRSTFDGSTVVIVSTLQAFRVGDKDGRKVYESSGALHHHFAGLDPAALAVLEKNDSGAVPYSLANVLRLRRPIVIVDEAHNARTALSFETLTRFRPSCILELTATPAKDDSPSNVLTHVSAKQLAAEDMVKLPIRLETRRDWLRLLADAVSLREGLEREARAEEAATGETIRPIMLIKAERRDKNRETLSVEAVEKALIEHCNVPEPWIARATGTDRGIDNVDLLATDCPIRFIITVDALKEGWDCSWAYVLCSVAEMKSDTAVEQIIGRVLRLPQARRKQSAALNRAYAFATSSSFSQTARALEDALVEGNGFNPLEAKDLIVRQTGEQDSFELPAHRSLPAKTISIGANPDADSWSPELRDKVQIDPEAGTLTLTSPLDESEISTVASGFLMESHRETFIAAAQTHSKTIEAIFASPAERGVRVDVPQFCVQRQGELELLDETHFLERPWNLRSFLDQATPPPTRVEEPQASYGEIALEDKGKVRWRFGSELADELRLIEVTENWSEARLIDWLDRNIPHPDIPADDAGVFIAQMINAWQESGWSLGRMVRERYPLRDIVEKRINTCRQSARQQAFQAVLFAEACGPVTVSAKQLFSYDPDRYPARWMCPRSGDFKKHYHRQAGELHDKGEEFEFALFIDQLPEVETWVRNLERQAERSFWLPTSTDRFYPDFVCKLADGRILVIEYKGADRWSNDDSKEKRRLGELWAERSEGLGIFAMPKGFDTNAVITAINADRLIPRSRQSKFAEHEPVALIASIVEEDATFPPGTIGTIVSVYENGKAYAVEFSNAERPPVIATLYPKQIRSAK